jgi:hypothetical protein
MPYPAKETAEKSEEHSKRSNQGKVRGPYPEGGFKFSGKLSDEPLPGERLQ